VSCGPVGTEWGVVFATSSPAARVIPADAQDLADPLTHDLDVDAVVIGAGPNGLVATCLLARAGWDVVLLEANNYLGGAVASVEHTPGYVSDLCSTFYPLAAASPMIRSLDLESHGLRWRRSERVLAHIPSPRSSTAAILHADPEGTAAALDAEAPGDGATWLRLVEEWRIVRDPLLQALFTPFPPVAGTVRMLARLGTPQALRLARRLLLPVDRLGAELFHGRFAPLLMAGNAMHADVPADAPGSGAFGWILAMLGQDVGFPVPEGGAGAFAAALARRARASGAGLFAPARVTQVVVGDGRALGVRLEGGRRIRARRAVLADVAAPALYQELLPAHQLPTRLLDEIDRCFEWDPPTVKVNWALRAPVPWRARDVALAGTVHLGCDLAGTCAWSSAIGRGQRSPHLFQIVGQLAATDPSRAPEGAESLWAYSHLPRGVTSPGQAAELARRMEEEIEAHAPGFGELVIDRWDQLPGDLEDSDANLVRGAVNGGTAQLFQQFVFRPTPGLGRTETPIEGLYLAGAAVSPGGGVHGVCGAMAARSAIAGARFGRIPRRLLVTTTRYLSG
jgi:phytoene dehydrogenase-like protein